MFDPLFLYRISHFLYLKKIKKLPSIFQRVNFFLNSCDIPPNVIIGRNVVFKHFGLGVVINQATEIGDGSIIMPHVVIGQNITSKEVKELHKIVIEKNVLIGTGAKIIATNTLVIGEGSTIGANAVVNRDIPCNQIWAGVPAVRIK